MDEIPKDYYSVLAPGVPNVRVISERLTEAEAQSRKREIGVSRGHGADRKRRMKQDGAK